MLRRRHIALFIAALAGAPPSLAGAITGERAKQLETLVRHDCGSCHGLTRKGGLGSDIRSQALTKHSKQSLTAIILDGVPGTAMPPWRPLLNEPEAAWIADYLLKGGQQ